MDVHEVGSGSRSRNQVEDKILFRICIKILDVTHLFHRLLYLYVFVDSDDS